MHEIICPHCSKAFKIDEAGYADILKQVRDGDFDKQLHERLELAEREKRDAIALAEANVTNALQGAAARKDAEIQALQAQLAAAEVARKLAVTEALGAVSKERDGLANELEQARNAQQAVMFSHVMVGVSDLEVSRKFYDALLGTLGMGPGVANKARYFYRSPSGTFGITTPINGEPATHANGGTIGFTMQSPAQADAFHAAGVANGGTTCEDPPGWRETSSGRLYLAYLRDPDGNKICALHRPAK